MSITSGGRLRYAHCILVHIEALIVAVLLLPREHNVSVPPTDTMKASIVDVQLGKPYTPCGGEYTPFGGEYTPVGGSVASCEASGHLPLGGLDSGRKRTIYLVSLHCRTTPAVMLPQLLKGM